MSMTKQQKEQLADRIVGLIKSDNAAAEIAALEEKVNNGDEGDDGMNSVMLAVCIAIREHTKR
jgi:hypothetical protein